MTLRSKPAELCDLSTPLSRLFDILKATFELENEYCISLRSIDVADELHDPRGIAAITARKAQALFHVAQPGVKTATDVVVGLVGEMCRSLPVLAHWAEELHSVTLQDKEVTGCDIAKEISVIMGRIAHAGYTVSDLSVDEENDDPDDPIIILG